MLGTGSDTFQLGGTGAATFDVSQIGAAAQYQGFGTFNKIDSSVWTLTGTSTFAGPVNVNGGTLAVNGDCHVGERRDWSTPGGTLAGTGIVPFTLLDNGAHAGAGPGRYRHRHADHQRPRDVLHLQHLCREGVGHRQ